MRRIALFTLLAGFLAPVLMSAPAYAQATRTWVSGVGDDNNTVNGCSRTAPCKTFAAAISVTDTNGEINCIDPGGFGTLTITKSITIDCTGTFGGILAAGVNGITINLTATPDPLKSVVLRGLNINGAGGGGQAGLKGVSILSAAVVTLEDVVIMNFTQQGVADARTAPGKLFIKNSVIRNNAGVGIVAAATGGTNVPRSRTRTRSITLYGLATGNGIPGQNHPVGILRQFVRRHRGRRRRPGRRGSTPRSISTAMVCKPRERSGSPIRISRSIPRRISGPTISFGDNRIYANTTPGTAPTVGAASSDHGKQ